MKKKILAECLRMAQKHLPNHPGAGECWLHWSFIVVNDKIVEWGTNMRGNVAIHYGYNKKVMDVDFPAIIHSEVCAYRRASKLLGKELQKFDVVNVRLNRKGLPKISAPCICCEPLMKELGAKHFYYTTEVGWGKIV